MPSQQECDINKKIKKIFKTIKINPKIPLNISLHSEVGLYLSTFGGSRGVMVIVVGNGHGDTSSNPGRDWLHFTYH